MSSSHDSSEPRSPASTEACIDEVVETTASAITRHLGDDARATLPLTRHISHEPRLDSDPEIDTDTERLPVMTVAELARASARMEMPSSLSAFEVPGRRLWPRGNVYEQATRKVPELGEDRAEETHEEVALGDDEIPKFRSSSAPWLFAAMALVVGLASSAAYFMHANMQEETRSPAVSAPPPPTIDDHVPPTPIVAPQHSAAAGTPAASGTGSASVVPRRRRF